MSSLIETKANEKIKRIEALTKQKDHLFGQSSKYLWIKLIDVSELGALIDLLCYCGPYGMNHHSLNILFSDKAGPPVFSATMPHDHMKFLLSTLTFNNPEEHKEK